MKYVTLIGLALFICNQAQSTRVQSTEKMAPLATQIEYTFAMIKPDAVAAKQSGNIIDLIEKNGFDIIRMEKVHMTEDIAREFYAVHKTKPFYNSLVTFMSSGPTIVMALAKENAVADWRKLMGATDPAKAEAGTIRKLFGTSIDKNAVHGSDSLENAKIELSMLFFDDLDENKEIEFCDIDAKKCCTAHNP